MTWEECSVTRYLVGGVAFRVRAHRPCFGGLVRGMSAFKWECGVSLLGPQGVWNLWLPLRASFPRFPAPTALPQRVARRPLRSLAVCTPLRFGNTHVALHKQRAEADVATFKHMLFFAKGNQPLVKSLAGAFPKAYRQEKAKLKKRRATRRSPAAHQGPPRSTSAPAGSPPPV